MNDDESADLSPTCLCGHGEMMAVDDDRWECIMCSFVVVITPVERRRDAAA